MKGNSNLWGGPLEVVKSEDAEEDCGTTEYDRAAYRPPEKELKQSWLLRPSSAERRNNKNVMNSIAIKSLLIVCVFAGLMALVGIITHHLRRRASEHHHQARGNYTEALHKAIMFFDAQRSGKLPKGNNISWRGDSCLRDGEAYLKGLAGGYYDSGSAIKFTFPLSFSMTMLSWSILEYREKYQGAGELQHVRDIVKWGTDYLLKTFKSSAKSISTMAYQVGREQDTLCWVRPEQIHYQRPVSTCSVCPAIAAETAAALAAASIVFRDQREYSKRLLRGADTLFKFATKQQGADYTGGSDPSTRYYNSSGFWDEFVWGASWMYYASGNISYLRLATEPSVAKRSKAFWEGPNRGVLGWDNKHAAAQLLLTRLRILLQYGYPYEEMLKAFHDEVNDIMCSYLPDFTNFKRTKGGLIQLSHGKPKNLQYVVNAAFLAALFSDYLDAAVVSGWNCGDKFYPKNALLEFARTQMNYILGINSRGMSFVVGVTDHYPQQVHHRGASIPATGNQKGCKDGYKWKNSKKPNPNTIVGAMVGGPYASDDFIDERSKSNYTEPSIAGNAGLVAALVALSDVGTHGIDKNSIFYAVPPLFTADPPPPPPWNP